MDFTLKRVRAKVLFAALLSIGMAFAPILSSSAQAKAVATSALKPITEQERAQPIPTDPELRKGQLSNGLKYYVLERTQPARSVELRLVVRAGAVNETETERGISHFLEHMVFNGTRLYPGNSMVDALENMGIQFGADLNAYTGFNETVYILPVPLNNSKNFKQSMEILEELAFNATFDPAEVKQERSVIMEEWRLNGLSAISRQQTFNLDLTAHNSIYPKRQPMGLTSVIQGMTPEMLRSYYKRWYRPDLMAVIVVGDVDANEAERHIIQHFAGHKNPPIPASIPNIQLPNNTEPLVGVFNDPDLTQNTVMLINKDSAEYKAQANTGAYIDTLQMNLITQMLNQRLQAQLDGASTSAPPFLQAGVEVEYVGGVVRSKQGVHWYAVAIPGQEAAALKALQNEAQRVVQHGFTQTELDRAVRDQLTFLNADSNNYQKATEYVRGFAELEPLPEITWERSAQKNFVPRITLAQINQVARRFIQDNNRVALVNSNSKQTTITAAHIKQILNDKSEQAAYQESATRDTLLATQPKAGKVVSTSYDSEINTTTWKLANGVTVHFRPVPNNEGPIIFSSFATGGFSRLSNEDWKKVQWGFDGLVDAGVNDLSKTQLNHLLAGKDFSMQISANHTTQGLDGKFNVKDSEVAFQMMHSLITGINHNSAAFNAYIQRKSASTASLKDDRETVFEEAIQNAMQKNNPRYHGLIPTEQDWKNTDFETTYRTYRELFGNANGMHFTFVGNGHPEQMKRLAEQYLGSLPSDMSQTLTERDNEARLNYNVGKIQVAKGKEALAQVRVLLGGTANYSESEKVALDALAHALNIRLVERLREKDGSVYSPYAYAQMSKQPYEQYVFAAGFACSPDKASTLISSTQEEIKALADKGIRPQDLLKFQLAERATYAKTINTNEFWVANIERAQQYQLPSKTITAYPDTVMQLTPEYIAKVAKKYLTGAQVTAVLLPE